MSKTEDRTGNVIWGNSMLVWDIFKVCVSIAVKSESGKSLLCVCKQNIQGIE